MSQTEKNLWEAFAGESQANRKYLAFAKKAEQEGYPQVARLFRAAAEAETVHAHTHLRTLKEDYHDYVLELEWRWPGQGGNNGVLVHTTTPGALGVWPKSIEVQLQDGNAGDFWIIGTELKVENEEERRSGRRYRNLVDDVEKPLGEWNSFQITCRGDEIFVKVNGRLVNHATDCSVTRGAIALQSEGTPIEYRDIRLRRLK